MIEKLVFSFNKLNISVCKLRKHSTIQIIKSRRNSGWPKELPSYELSTRSSVIKFQSLWVMSRDPTFPMNI
jgi:hypothetical protein